MTALSLLVSTLALAADPPGVDPSGAPPSGAAPSGAEAPATVEIAVAPTVVSTPPVAWPAEALAAGVEAEVLLGVDLAADGTVLDARVVEGAAESPWAAAFDAAALAAVRQYRFTPALDAAGVAVPAQLLYRYRFTVARAAAVSVEGAVLATDGAPVAGATVRLLGPDGQLREVTSGGDGAFSLAGLPAGPYAVAVTAAGFETTTAQVEVRDGRVAVATVRLTPSDVADLDLSALETVEVVAERPTTEVIERVLSTEEIQYLPGTGGDVVRVVQNLPGVARAPLGVGQLIIRGSAPEDSSFFLDGASIPIVFHFAGFSTILNGDALEEVAYLPGNFSVRYGRTLGGLVDLRTRDALPEESRGYVSVDLIQATAYVEQKIGARTALTVSGRRSYVDAILNPILNSGEMGGGIRAPRYWDASARLFHERPGGGTLDLLAIYSDDGFRVLGEEEDEVVIGLTTTFARLRGRWLEPLRGGWQNELTLIGGPDDQSFFFAGEAGAFERSQTVGLREELRREAGADQPLGLRFGLDTYAGREAFEYDVEVFSPYEASAAWFVAPAAYAEASWIVGPLTLSPGLRADALAYDTGYASLTADPRLSARLVAGPTTAVKLGVGRYSSFPTLRQVTPEADGNPDLHAAYAIQSAIGVEQQVGSRFRADATVFCSGQYERVVGREDRFRFFTGPPPIGPFDEDPYANDGTGRIYGAETLLRYDGPTTLAFLSATFSRSSRVDRPGEEAQLFEYDQPVVLNALASQELPRGWRVGARARFSSGNPYTPVVNRIYDLSSRSFFPVYGERDSARLPPFWAVDVRVDKEWAFRRWTLTTYLDLQNAFNTQNVEVMAWTYDYGEEDPITGLPILPSLGLKGEW